MAKRGRKPAIDLTGVACPNPECSDFARTGAPSLVANGAYPTKNGISRRFLCRTCGHSFCSRTGSVFYDRRVEDERILAALKLLVKGVSLRAVADIMHVKSDTARAWLIHAARHRDEFNARLLAEPGITPPQLDELWRDFDSDQLRSRAILWRQRRGWKQ